MKNTDPLLANVRIASPCTARWEDMEGDEQSRFCHQCTKYVYNFSAMTSDEAVKLIRAREGNLCARFYQRTDGTVLTSDCPVGAERPVHWFKRVLSAAAACLCLSGASALSDEKPVPSRRVLMGEMCVSPRGTNVTAQVKPSTNQPPLLGKIALPPPRNSGTAPANNNAGSNTPKPR